MTPDTGSDDEVGKDEEEGYELEEGPSHKYQDDGLGSAQESRPRQPRQLYTPEEERAVVRKFDRKLVVFVALLYMLSFLDRSSTHTPSPRFLLVTY